MFFERILLTMSCALQFYNSVDAHSEIINSYWCGGDFVVPTTIETPFFPESYPPFTTCEWYLKSPDDRSIVVDEYSYSIQPSNATTGECDRDFLSFYTTRANFTLCGSNIVRTYDTESNMIKVVFHSDHLVQAGGFKISFSLTSDNAILDS